ncbi:MAG TPA: HupE/UreJ family protein, partial [Gemmatimonadaceae bacterium]|nr:HupE/UreJ family protein [Gemmatimonadaceae bacterium]
ELPSRFVESVIAGSITIAALHNIWPVARVNEAAIAFVFGLFHGFGFASVLGDIGLGTDHLVLSLLGFNLGVEIGQVAIIAAIFPVLFFVRRWRVYNWGLRVASVGLMAIGLLWAAERTFGFNVALVPMAKAMLGMGGGDIPT